MKIDNFVNYLNLNNIFLKLGNNNLKISKSPFRFNFVKLRTFDSNPFIIIKNWSNFDKFRAKRKKLRNFMRINFAKLMKIVFKLGESN